MTCGPILYHSSGQVATIVLENAKDAIIDRVYNPDFKTLNGFPAPMFVVPNEENICAAKIKLPARGAGTYLCIVSWKDAKTLELKKTVYSIIIDAPKTGGMGFVAG